MNDEHQFDNLSCLNDGITLDKGTGNGELNMKGQTMKTSLMIFNK